MRRLLVLGAALAALTTGSLFGATTGTLKGKVVDSTGAPMPGVTVTATSPTQIGGAKVATTAEDGTFNFPTLAPGEYKVTAELEGFVPQERDQVQVRLDRTTAMELTIAQANVAETINVTAETPVVDPEQVGTATTFTNDYLQNAAISSTWRSYQNILLQAGGVTEQDGAGGNPSVYGSTLGENAFLIDGVDTTDPVTSTFGTNFNFDAIQEISFQTGGFEAEYGRATGGVVNVITKSGGNQISGTVDVRYRDKQLYENGDHFNRDANPVKYFDPSATLGGPILRDKLWYFLSAETIDSQLTPGGSPTTRKYEGQNYLGKLTWQINPNWQAAAKYSADPADIDNDNADNLVAAEAAQFQTQGGHIVQAEASSVLTQNLLFDIKGSINRQKLDAYPQSGDFSTPGHVDLDTGLSYVNYANAQYSNRDRDELKTSLTYFAQGAGSHEIKGGVEYSNLKFDSQNYTVSGFYFYDLSSYGANPFKPDFSYPFVMNVSSNPGTSESTGKLATAYLQDAWRISERLTAKLGVRYDNVKFDNDAGTQVADMTEWQPRLGLAWDIQGDATTVARASYGRFMHPNALTLPNFARLTSAPTEQWRSCSLYAELFGTDPADCAADFGANGFRNDPFGIDPNGWWLRSVTSRVPNTIQDGIKPTYADELIVSFERQLLPRTSVTLTYVDKKTRDIAEDTCNGNVPTPGASGACDNFVMANIPGLKRDYQGAIVQFESRATDWLHLLASYTWSKSKGNVEYTQNAGGDFDYYPAHYVNTYGYLSDDARHRVKINGYATLPLDFSVGFQGTWTSAFAYDRTTTPDDPGYGTEYLDPRGSHRANDVYQLDLQVTKGFELGPVNARLIAAILNVTGSEAVNEVCENDGGCPGGVAFGGATDWQNPRRYEAGFRLEF